MTEKNRSILRPLTLIILLLFVVVMTAGTVFAAKTSDAYLYKNEQTGYAAIIFDEAELLTDEEEAELEEYLNRITPYATAIFVTSDTAHTSSISQHARDTLESICGSAGLDGYTAIIFMIDMYSRKLYIYSGETANQTITNDFGATITDNTYTYATRGDYFGCAKETFTQIFKVLDGQRIAQPMRYITAALLAIFAGLAFSLILVRIKTKKIVANTGVSKETLDEWEFRPQVQAVLVNTRKVRRDTDGGGFHGGGFSGGGFHGGGFSGGGFHGGGGGFHGGGGGFHGGGGGFHGGGGGGGFSGHGGGGGHSF